MVSPKSILERLSYREDVSVLEALERLRGWGPISVMIGPALAACSYALVQWANPAGLPHDGRVMLSIFSIAAWYWVSGAIPPFATAVLVVGLGALLVGYPAGLIPETARDAGSSISGWAEFVSVGTAPVVILMLGGFVLSKAAQKHGLDRVFASAFIKPFAVGPRRLVLGVLLVTSLFSMWMSNTATAAMMIALLGPVIARLPSGSKLRVALLLAVPIGANLGGIGTPIGTPPNAIAYGALAKQGVGVGFLSWMEIAVPFAAVMILLGWALLCVLYPPSAEDSAATAELRAQRVEPTTNGMAALLKKLIVGGTFALTIGLWITSEWTRLPNGAIALIPIVVFTTTRLLDRRDINSLEWDILLLITGGLALGLGMERSGLAAWLVGVLPVETLGPVALVAVLSAATVLLSTFMSNTAAANLLIPLGFGIATATAGQDGAGAVTAGQIGVAIAFSASLAMSLPVSTPPNAIAFARGGLRTTDFVRVGAVIGALGVVLSVVLVRLAGGMLA